MTMMNEHEACSCIVKVCCTQYGELVIVRFDGLHYFVTKDEVEFIVNFDHLKDIIDNLVVLGNL